MKKTTIALLIIGILSVGFVAAHGMMGGSIWKGERGMMGGEGWNTQQGMWTHHEGMEKIMEEGSYKDLENYRKETGFKVMPWVENEKDFELAKQMHERMEKWYEENGKNIGAGCPMHDFD